MVKVFIGVDIGTTSTKTCAYTQSGEVVTEQEHPYELLTPKPDYVEQHPEDMFNAVMKTLTACANQVKVESFDIAAVSFSSAMHSLIAMDEDGQPLTNVITWADRRSLKQAEALKETRIGHNLYLRTGTPIHPMSPLTKLIWFKENDQSLFNKAQKWVSIKEYVFYRLFDQFVVDYSVASATGLFNLENLTWDAGALSEAGITSDQLSAPVATTYQITGLTEKVSEQLGIDKDTPFVVGATDGVLANLGVGALSENVAACTIGTSGAVRTVVPKPITDPKGRIFCYALTENHWVIGGPVNNGGIAFQWLRDNVFPDFKENDEPPYEAMTKLAAETNPGADGLLFLPSLTGERAPFWNADTRAVFFGLSLSHTRGHMIRSVLEGVVFQLQSVVGAMEEMGVRPNEFRATGGFTRSPFWLQVMADIFEADIRVPETPQSACYGAVVLAMLGLGEIDDLADGIQVLNMKQTYEPDGASKKIYRRLAPLFTDLSEKLQGDFSKIASIQRDIASFKE